MFMVQLIRCGYDCKWFFHSEENAVGFAEENVERNDARAILWKYNETTDCYDEVIADIG